MAIIVISHQMGAGGPEIGMALAQRLGYRYVNQELLLDAARRYGLAEEKLSHLEESKPTLFERFDTETRHHITVLQTTQDRKSTRLNSSHRCISYAVFCLKKKKPRATNRAI